MYELEVPVVRCMQCSLVYLNPQPRVDHQGFYDEEYYRGTSTQKADIGNIDVLETGALERRLESCRGVVDRVLRHVPAPGRWLDIGCGPGFLLSEARNRGWHCTGLDSSPFAPKFARERFGLDDVHSGLIEDASFEKETFDVISMQHVIEHLYEPVNTMREVIGLLKPGGILYLETPDINSGTARRDGKSWVHIKIPEHVLYFSQQTLEKLMCDLDCDVLGVSKPVPGTGLMNKLCGGKERAKRFYAVARKFPLFEATVSAVRSFREKSNEDETDCLQLMARKTRQ